MSKTVFLTDRLVYTGHCAGVFVTANNAHMFLVNVYVYSACIFRSDCSCICAAVHSTWSCCLTVFVSLSR